MGVRDASYLEYSLNTERQRANLIAQMGSTVQYWGLHVGDSVVCRELLLGPLFKQSLLPACSQVIGRPVLPDRDVYTPRGVRS